MGYIPTLISSPCGDCNAKAPGLYYFFGRGLGEGKGGLTTFILSRCADAEKGHLNSRFGCSAPWGSWVLARYLAYESSAVREPRMDSVASLMSSPCVDAERVGFL